jgi:hypothetical protein
MSLCLSIIGRPAAPPLCVLRCAHTGVAVYPPPSLPMRLPEDKQSRPMATTNLPVKHTDSSLGTPAFLTRASGSKRVVCGLARPLLAAVPPPLARRASLADRGCGRSQSTL